MKEGDVKGGRRGVEKTEGHMEMNGEMREGNHENTLFKKAIMISHTLYAALKNKKKYK